MKRPRLATVLLAGYVGLSLLDVTAELTDRQLLARLLMLLLMPVLAGHLWLSGARGPLARWVLVGRGFAWLGDGFGDPLLLKLVFFLGTQIAYSLAFRPYWRSSVLARPVARVLYAVVLGALIVVVSLQAGELLVAVAVYGASLALMVALATGVSRLAAVGAVSFLVSDTVLGYGAFVDPPATPAVRALVMATYLGAQLLIVLAVRREAVSGPGSGGGPVDGRL
jgi:uncharacterized membrane protein YhhN